MKTLTLFVISSIAMTSSFAGSGHFHPKKVAKCSGECTEEQLKAALPDAIDHLAAWGKIDKSWKNAKVESITKKAFKKGEEWVLSLERDGKKRFVFITLDGFAAGSNDTGN